MFAVSSHVSPTAHKVRTGYTVGEKPTKIYHIMEDTECHG